ncbi:hypothetical protein CLOM_g22916 [Closterium sp. NIES-68]|nr:hypothetical protein CLOM_g22916 [Closterium sp. NIES-68]
MGASHRNGQAAIHAQASPSRQAAIGGHTPSPSQLPHSHTPHPQQGAVTRQPLIGQFAQPHTGRRKKGKGKGTPGAARRSEQPDTTPPSAGAQPLPATTPQATPSLPPACHPLPSHNQDGELRTIGESFRRALAAEDPAGIDPHIATALADLPPSVRALLPPLSSCISSAPDGLFSERIATQRRDAGSGEEASARIFECALTTRVSVALQRAQANIITQHAVRQLGESDDAWMPIPCVFSLFLAAFPPLAL